MTYDTEYKRMRDKVLADAKADRARVDRVWEGPRRKVREFNGDHWLVQVGWWLEPEARFVPIMDELVITGSAAPVYCEVGD